MLMWYKRTYFLVWMLFLMLWGAGVLSLTAQNRISPKEWMAIQQDPHYLIGSGRGADVAAARQNAMADLAGRISTKVESQFSHVLQNKRRGDKVSSESKMNNIIQTYTSVTLDNVAEYQVKERGEFVVYRYMKDAELRAMFRRRINMAKKWAHEAAQRRQEGKIGDALQDYYWSLALLRSCPDPDLEKLEQETGETNMMQEVYQSVKDILNDVSVKAVSVMPDDDGQRVVLEFLYGGKPVVNFNYKTCDKNGTDCGEVYTAKDGVGELFLPRGTRPGRQKVWAEYEFRDEANIHPELQTVMADTDPVPFKAAELAIDDRDCATATTVEPQIVVTEAVDAPTTNAYTVAPREIDHVCLQTVKTVSKALATGNDASLKDCFTTEGWDMFSKLMSYGRAKMLKSDPELHVTACGDYVVCRSLPMSFTFKSNRRTFTEDVVLYLTPQGKVCEVAFALEAAAVSDIMSRQWDEYERYIMIHFLETYKTAYALKRLDYISSIFSSDALIITGSMVKSTGNRELGPKKMAHVKYTRQTKEEYMKSLERCFRSNEYVNWHFGDNIVRSSNTKPHVYGIQIKQNYFSQHYGDTGYLFLLIEFKSPTEPVIHVRTWQPDKDPTIKDGRIGITDFIL